MPSTFFGLNIAYSGINHYQAALNTTGNNIANAATKGYTRQQTVQEAAMALRTNTTYGMAGSGVVTTAIEQVRNTYYDLRFWENNANLGQYEIKHYYMRQIEDYFKEIADGQEGFNTLFNKFFNAIADVKKYSSDPSRKENVISTGQNLADFMKAMAENLHKLQLDVNAELENKTRQINGIAEQIATLNKQINTIEMNTDGLKANELRDKRNLLIDELSKIVNVDVDEVPISNSLNPDMVTGAHNYIVKIAGGQMLVDGYEYNTIECTARTDAQKRNQTDADGLYNFRWSNGLEFNLYGKNLGGEMKALVELRDGNNQENFKGVIEGFGANGPDQTVTIKATDSYLCDISKSNLPAAGIVRLYNMEIEYSSWEMTLNADGTANYTFTLKEPVVNTGALINKNASIGKSVDYQGIPYYLSQMNEWIRNFAAAVNKELKHGYTSYKEPGDVLFVYTDISGAQKTFGDVYEDPTAPGYDPANPFKPVTSWSSIGDSYYNLTAFNFTVSEKMKKDSEHLAVSTSKNPDIDVDAYNVLDEIEKIKTDTRKMSFRGRSSREFLECLSADMALNAKSASIFTENYANIGNSIDLQRKSVSGVDEDEEALDLSKFQRGLDLSSKMIQVLTEVYDRLILQTGV